MSGHIGSAPGDRRLMHMTAVFVVWIGVLAISAALGGSVTLWILGLGLVGLTVWGVVTISAALRSTRREVRALHIVCPGCAYDLAGLRTDECPECGLPLDANQVRLRKRFERVMADEPEDDP